MQYNGAELQIKMTQRGTATHSYEVRLLSGTWPSDSELISLCDGNNGTERCDFGGSVKKQIGDVANVNVNVYVD
jgi:hypothetical protein